MCYDINWKGIKLAVENSLYDKKSLRTVIGKTADFSELAKDCVAFANSKGGVLDIGIEDEDNLPSKEQRIPAELIVRIEKRISENTINVNCSAEKLVAENGGEYIKLHVFCNKSTIASTSDGKYYMRVGDSSKPVKADEFSFILTDRATYVWETQKSHEAFDNCDKQKLSLFINDIRKSSRVSDFIKSKTDNEILEHYYLVTKDGFLTNLGCLWIGNTFQRANVWSAPKIQVIKYDSRNEKINKFMYDDDDLTPKELIDAVWNDIPDWKEYYEIPNTIHRDRVSAYEYKVIRELLVNAIVHRPYTMRGDIFIKLYPDRMEITNPGTLPLGITPENIFNSSFQRNEKFGKIFFDLNYMEKEGSGYHLIYQLLLFYGKPLPKIKEGDDSVTVTIMRRPINDAACLFMNRVNEAHELSQNQTIALGLIVQARAFSVDEVADILEIKRLEAFSLIDNLYTSGIIAKYSDKDLYFLRGIEGKISASEPLPHQVPTKYPSSTHQPTHQVKKLLDVLDGELSKKKLMELVGIKDKVSFRENYIQKALELGLIEMTQPKSPNSPTQKYRLTGNGKIYKMSESNIIGV